MPSIGNITGGMRVEFRVNGLEDVRKKMLSLNKQVALRIVKDGLKAGAVVIRDKARANLAANQSVFTGALLQSIIVRTGRANSPNQIGGFEEWAGVTIAPTVFESRLDEGGTVKLFVLRKRGAAPAGSIKPRAYAHLVEFGVRPHTTGRGDKLQEVVIIQGAADKKGRRRKQAVATGRGGPQLGRGHPGSPARPFIRPAYDGGRFEAQAMIVATVRRRLEEEVAPWAKQAARRSA